MEYKIVETKQQKFIAIVGEFRNEIVNEEGNQDIPYFWNKCGKDGLIAELLDLKKSHKDLYGLCSNEKTDSDSFEYGIGILVDDNMTETYQKEMEELGFKYWNVKPGTYVVLDCIGYDKKAITNAWAKFYQEFLPQTGYTVREETDYELYFEDTKANVFCELWVPIKK